MTHRNSQIRNSIMWVVIDTSLIAIILLRAALPKINNQDIVQNARIHVLIVETIFCQITEFWT